MPKYSLFAEVLMSEICSSSWRFTFFYFI